MTGRAVAKGTSHTKAATSGTSGCLAAVGIAYALTFLGLAVAQCLAPQQDGALALVRVLAPYLFLPLLCWVPAAFGRDGASRWLRRALLVCLLVAVIWFPPRWHGNEQGDEPNAAALTALTWNLHLQQVETPAVRDHVLAQGADIVALQECDWQLPLDDPQLVASYPYRLADQGQTLPPGIRLLSRYPIAEYGVITEPDVLWDIPRVLWARLILGGGQELIVVTAHPRPPMVYWAELGVFYTHQRDGQIGALRQVVAYWTERGYPVLVMGDLNVTEREPAYAAMIDQGLRDAHVLVGRGWGHTWRVGPLPALRIDYMLTNQGLAPLAIQVNRNAPASDHCSVVGWFRLTGE